MPPYFAWQALGGQGWPASEDQELVLVEHLRRAAGNKRSPSRAATTVLLNALRCGVTYDELIDTLPAVNAGDMVAAHDQLTQALRHATGAWNRLVHDPSPECLALLGATASLVLPVPVHRIEVALAAAGSASAVGTAVTRIRAEVDRVTVANLAIERKLASVEPGSQAGIRLGRSLHDGGEPGGWTHPHFLPTRVGQLSTTRVRDLRGDGN